MSQTRGSREEGRPDILHFLDASDGPFDVPKFAHRVGVVTAYAEDGTPIIGSEGTLDHHGLRWHDLQQKTSQGLPDRRLRIQQFVDFDAQYADARDGDAPYEQKENFTALNPTTRWADKAGRVALPTSLTRLIGSEDGRDAVALAIRGPLLGEPDEVDVTTDPEELNALGLPEGVSFHGTGSVGGTGGTVTATQPRVVVGGLSFFGQASIDAAAKVARAGGSITQIADAARAAAFGLPPPPFTPPTGPTKTRPPAPVRNKAGSVVPNNHPLGYMWEEGVDRIGLMGTLFTAGALDKDVRYFEGREATPVNRLAMRHDGHVAMSETRTGRVHYVPTEISGVPEGDGDMIKGWMMHDASVANTGTEVGQETGQWRPVVRVGLKDITTRNPPPRVQPGGSFVELKDPEENILDGTKTKPLPGGNTEELSDDGRFIITRSPNGTVLEVKRVSGGILSPVNPNVVGGGGSPGPSVTAVGTAPGHLAIVASPGGDQLLIGAAAPGPITDSGFEGGIPLGLPGAPGTGGPITDSGFEGPLPLGIPGGTPGGFGFEPQPESGGLTQSEADAANAAKEAARAAERQMALDAEQKAIDDLKAKGEDVGGRAGARMVARAERAQKARDAREARRQKREDYKRRKKEERERRKREREARRKKKKEQREAAVAAANAAADERKAAAQAEAKATGLFGSIGYVIDVTDPEAPVTFGDGDLAAQDEAEKKRALGGGSGLGSLGVAGGFPNTATTILPPPGAPGGGPKNMQGWTAMATYAINSQQVITTGAFGGGGFLNAPINVVEVVEDGKTPTGSTLGQQIIATGGGTQVFGSPPLNVVGGIHATRGTTVRAGGAGMITVTRPQTGGGTIVDDRPGIFIPPPGGFGQPGSAPRPPKPAVPGKPDAIVVGEGGSAGGFLVHHGGGTTTTSVTVAAPAGTGSKPAISVGVINAPDGKIYGTPAFGVNTVGTTSQATTPEVPTAQPGVVQTFSVGQALGILGAAGGATIVGGGFIGFGTPIKADDGSGGSSSGVGHVGNGVTMTKGPLGGVKAEGTDDDGNPTGGPSAELSSDDGHFFTGNVSIVGKLSVTGRIDPVTLEFTDTDVNNIPLGEAGFRFDSTYDPVTPAADANERPLWNERDGTVRQIAYVDDLDGGDADTLDGLDSTDFASATDLATLQADVDAINGYGDFFIDDTPPAGTSANIVIDPSAWDGSRPLGWEANGELGGANIAINLGGQNIIPTYNTPAAGIDDEWEIVGKITPLSGSTTSALVTWDAKDGAGNRQGGADVITGLDFTDVMTLEVYMDSPGGTAFLGVESRFGGGGGGSGGGSRGPDTTFTPTWNLDNATLSGFVSEEEATDGSVTVDIRVRADFTGAVVSGSFMIVDAPTGYAWDYTRLPVDQVMDGPVFLYDSSATLNLGPGMVALIDGLGLVVYIANSTAGRMSLFTGAVPITIASGDILEFTGQRLPVTRTP